MPCIVDAEKSNTNDVQKDSQLVVNGTDLKMDGKTMQENGVENLNGENGHVNGEVQKDRENGNDINVEEDAKNEAKNEEPKDESEKTEGIIYIFK